LWHVSLRLLDEDGRYLGFRVAKKYGRTPKEVEVDVAATVLNFISEV